MITHDPCCSSHNVPMDCARYRLTHFCEVRPCCEEDAKQLATESAAHQGRLSLDEGNLRRVAANYYNARPEHLKFQRIPTFDNMSGYLQREFIDLVRGVLEAAMQEES